MVLHTVRTPERSVFIPTTVGYIICSTQMMIMPKVQLTVFSLKYLTHLLNKIS